MASLVGCGAPQIVVFNASTGCGVVVDGATVILDDRSSGLIREVAISEVIVGKVLEVEIESFVVSPAKRSSHATSVIFVEPSRVGCASDPGKSEPETSGSIVIVHDVQLLKSHLVSKRWIPGGRFGQTRRFCT